MYDIIDKLLGEEIKNAAEQAKEKGRKEGEIAGAKKAIEKCRSIMRFVFNNKDQVSLEDLLNEFDKKLS